MTLAECVAAKGQQVLYRDSEPVKIVDTFTTPVEYALVERADATRFKALPAQLSPL